MAPDSDKSFKVSCAIGYEGTLSADAFGINCCLYGYSHLSFSDDIFLDHYYWLKDYIMEHKESEEILRSIG